MTVDSKCGLCGINPKWLQSFSTTRTYIVVYGLLGTIQSMAFVYTSVCLTTLEKRFKIPSQTIGILLSGNEISQVLSVILIYYGGSGHRPRWIAMGVGFSALSCLVFALPHIIYGPGEEALALTQEYLNTTILTTGAVKKNELPICSKFNSVESCDVENSPDTSTVPQLLVFFSQLILGVGITMYYGLGQTYMDDNTKKKNAPLLLGVTFSLRTIGPVFGYILSYYCLRLYIDPTLHPLIDDKNPRWLGAWWLGWIFLGLLIGFFALLFAMFPRDLKKSKSKKKVPLNDNEVPLKLELLEQKPQVSQTQEPNMKDFIVSTKRILKNKLYMFNNFSCVFYIYGFAPFVYFISKYLEVQYGTSSGGGTLLSGPLKEIGMVFGYLLSGIIVGRYKPRPRTLMGWNVFVGVVYFAVNILFIYIKCDTGVIQGVNFETMTLNLTNPCNEACHCDGVQFSPVCHEPSRTTFFSACHAGCQKVINDTAFGDCNCVSNLDYRAKDTLFDNSSLRIEDQFLRTYQSYENVVSVGPCKQNCFKPYVIFSVVLAFAWTLVCSVRVGSVLLSFRCVEVRDKSLAQGVAMMLLSLVSVMPSPIIAGALMDSTCLIWDVSCKNKGNCWVYNKDQFNYVVNMSGSVFIFIGVFFDVLVWYYSQGIDLYAEEEDTDQQNISQSKNNDVMYNEVSNSKS